MSALLTVKQTADALAVSTRTVRRCIDSGEIPVVRLGKRVVRVPADALKRLTTPTKKETPS